MGINQWQRQEKFKESLRFVLGAQLRDRQAKGFTLLELIIIAIMVGVLAALAIPSFLGYLSRQRLNTAQQQVLQEMRRAQSEARRRQEDFQFSLTTNDDGLIAIAVHPAAIADMEGTCVPALDGDNGNLYQVLSDTTLRDNTPEIQIDRDNSNLGPGLCDALPTVVRQRINSRGEANDGGVSLGRLTLQLESNPEVRRCIFVSTILGALRTDRDDGCPIS